MLNHNHSMKLATVIAILSAGASAGTALAEEEITAPLAAETAAEDSPTSGWFRLDTDAAQTQIWFGATHQIGPVALASDIYVVGSSAELDLGVALTFGDLVLTPMAGFTVDFASGEMGSLVVPQLFTIFSPDKIHFESWIQVFFKSAFDDDAADVFYTRDFLLYKLFDELHVGVQAELSYGFNDPAALLSLPVGVRANVGYGKNNVLGIFLGYETQEDDGTGPIAGRFTFIRTW